MFNLKIYKWALVVVKVNLSFSGHFSSPRFWPICQFEVSVRKRNCFDDAFGGHASSSPAASAERYPTIVAFANHHFDHFLQHFHMFIYEHTIVWSNFIEVRALHKSLIFSPNLMAFNDDHWTMWTKNKVERLWTSIELIRFRRLSPVG